jgi:sodium/hydrogen exchanger 8
MNIWRKDKIPYKHMFVQWWAGLRGAVAIILALTQGNPMFTNAVYVIVLFTNLIMGFDFFFLFFY